MKVDDTRLLNETIDKYLENVLEANKKINLTNITDLEEAKVLLLEDSLAVLEELNEAPKGIYGDLGSGGGFPGVPLGIASNRKTVLIDSVTKKMNAVKAILNQMNITNIDVCPKRIEELSLEKPNSFNVLTAKGLSQIPSLLELASPLLEKNGLLIALKSREENSFDDDSLKEKLGMRLVKERQYNLSDKDLFRKVFVFEKYKDPEIDLPRRNGLAQKRPFK